MEEPISLADQVKNKVIEALQEGHGLKSKEMKLPRKGRVSKGKSKKGWVSVQTIDEGGNVTFQKQQIEGSTYRIDQGTYHAVHSDSPLTYKGKPFFIQVTKKLNPYNPLQGENETVGQRYIMARMLSDAIKLKKKATGLIAVVGFAVAGFIIYSILKGGV